MEQDPDEADANVDQTNPPDQQLPSGNALEMIGISVDESIRSGAGAGTAVLKTKVGNFLGAIAGSPPPDEYSDLRARGLLECIGPQC
jgi:hypothetical protein